MKRASAHHMPPLTTRSWLSRRERWLHVTRGTAAALNVNRLIRVVVEKKAEPGSLFGLAVAIFNGSGCGLGGKHEKFQYNG